MIFLQVAEIVSDKVASVLFLQQRGILHYPRNCARPMTLSLRDKGDRWRCSARGCRREVHLSFICMTSIQSLQIANNATWWGNYTGGGGGGGNMEKYHFPLELFIT